MRCNEAKRRLTAVSFSESEIADDTQLLEHLRRCSVCAHLVRAEQELRQAFAAIDPIDDADTLCWAEQKARVEARLALNSRNRAKETTIMSNISKQLKRRPSLSLSVGVVTVLLLVATLIPFKYDHTVGYEVAFAGVDPQLAMDGDKIDDLLERLGVKGAAVNVTDCDPTCKVKISELKSPDDARLIIATFDGLDHVKVIEGIAPVVHRVSATLLDRAKDRVTFFASGDEISDDEAHQIVIERLGDDFSKEIQIWISCDTDSLGQFDLGACEDSLINLAVFHSDLDGEHEFEIDARQIIVEQLNTDVDGEEVREMFIRIEGDDELQGILDDIDFTAGEIDAATIERLAEAGYEVVIEESEDGSMKTIMIQPIDSADSDADESDSAAKEVTDGELPEGYALSQNYPNPFNPTTRIDYAIAEAQHVKLEVFNIQGQKVRTLVDRTVSPGSYTVEWDAASDTGNRVASGIYFYRFEAGDNIVTKKMTLLK